MYCPSGSLLEIIHNTDKEQITTIMKKKHFHDRILPDSRIVIDKLIKEVDDIRKQHKVKNIMLVNTNESYIITNFFKRISHSFYMTEINAHDFIQFIGIRNERINPSNKNTITIVDDDFNEHIFKEDNIIVW